MSGKNPEDDSGTRIDLGDDLLQQPAEQAAGSVPQVSAHYDIEDALNSVDILVSENLIDPAKKQLREILRHYPNHPQASQKLTELHQQELKRMLQSEETERRSRQSVELGTTKELSSSELLLRLEEDLGIENSDSKLEELRTEVERRFLPWKQALEDQLTDQRSYIDLGISFLEMGLWGWAEECFKKALIHGAFLEGTCLLATSYLLSNRPLEAVLVLDPLVADGDVRKIDKIEAFYLLGRGHELLGKPESALAAYQEVSNLDGRYRDIPSRLQSLSRRRRG